MPDEPQDRPIKPIFTTILAAVIFAMDVVHNTDADAVKNAPINAFNDAERFVEFAETKYPGVFDDG